MDLNFDGVRDAVIFGVEGQTLALARQLENHRWNVLMVDRKPEVLTKMNGYSPRIEIVPDITSQVLANLDISRAESVVLMLSDQENYEICELIYEKFGIENVIVRLHDRANFEKFHELGAIVVEPWTSMVSLLDQFVRSPYAASLLLGMEPEEECLEIEMNNPDLSGVAIRDIHFPHDVLVLSVTRKGDRLDSHGYTRFETGDVVTVVGSPDSLTEVQTRFEVALNFSKN